MPEPNEHDSEFPLPPPSFSFLVESILMQTQMQLGLFSMGAQEEKEEPNLKLARHSIDLLSVLHEKTHGNLTIEEQRLLENGLTEVRFRFVQVSEELKKAKQKPAVEKADDQPLIITSDGGKGSRSE
jgi:hypothetical protein